MTGRSILRFPSLRIPVCRLLLRAAGLLAPSGDRAEWLAEWEAELWHISRAKTTGAEVSEADSSPEAIAFCLGAFPDALWLRRHDAAARARRSLRPRQFLRPRQILGPGAPGRCVASLALGTIAAALLCFCLPTARQAMLPSPYPRSNELVMISPEGDSPQPSVRLADYRAWKTNTRPLFSAIAFYLPTIKRVRIAPHRTAELSIIRASASLFELLRLPTCAGDVSQRSGRGPTPQLLLSDSAWRKDFQGDPRIVGRVVEIGGRRVRIAGVLAQDRWRLPGRADGWMLPDNIQDKGQENGQDKGENRGQDDAQLDAMPSSAKGYVLARIRASSFPPGSADRRWMTVYRRNGEEERFECFSLAALERQPASIFLFALLLACLALPATTPLPLGEYPARAERLAWEIRARRWLFLAAKLGLMLPLAYCAALALAYGVVAHGGSSPGGGGPQYVELAAAFLGMLFGFRWALRDQRGRCPVCLRRLTHPARVGEASRNFLAWNGTELICAGGHGLLHIPEIPTSWFGCQRWLYLDPSWSGLFGDAYAASVAVS